jgi:hypothetical protein
MCVWNQCTMLVKIYCYSKCGVVLEELNPHLPFGDHLLGNCFLYWTKTRGFLTFSIVIL